MNPFAEFLHALRHSLNDVADIIAEFERQGGFQNLLRDGVLPNDSLPALDGASKKTIAQYYANLELEYGADMVEVKRAYRKLMHKYHPDKHSDDPRRERLATQICQELTIAYTQIEKYHSRGRRS